MFTTDDLDDLLLGVPFAHMLARPGSARRSRPCRIWSCRACAPPPARPTILGTTMVGLALGPYFAGKVAEVTGSLAPESSRSTSSRRHPARPVDGIAAHRRARSDPRGAREPPARRSSSQHPAGDPVAAVAARIGPVIVGLGVDHQRRPVGIDDRVGACAQPRLPIGKMMSPLPSALMSDWRGRRDARPRDCRGHAAGSSDSSARPRFRI